MDFPPFELGNVSEEDYQYNGPVENANSSAGEPLNEEGSPGANGRPWTGSPSLTPLFPPPSDYHSSALHFAPSEIPR